MLLLTVIELIWVEMLGDIMDNAIIESQNAVL